MRVAVISDSHGRAFTIPECDLFIHCGDITAGGSFNETASFANWLREQKLAREILLVPGNHDRCFEMELATVRTLFDPRVRVLVDQPATVGGKTFWGTPWTKLFCNWHFMDHEDGLARRFDSIPDDLDMLISHGPPRGILDPGHNEAQAGSEALLEAVSKRRIRHHVFGHLHAAGGQSTIRRGDLGLTHFHNVACVDEAYNRVRDCEIIEL